MISVENILVIFKTMSIQFFIISRQTEVNSKNLVPRGNVTLQTLDLISVKHFIFSLCGAILNFHCFFCRGNTASINVTMYGTLFQFEIWRVTFILIATIFGKFINPTKKSWNGLLVLQD